MKTEILKTLHEFEKANSIKILFAVESGSREWGFASDDSDYDVRCVHCSPVESYLGIEKKNEQIELIKGDIDIVSWDIKKFAGLFLASNPSVSEWLRSGQIYIDSPVRKKFSAIFRNNFSRFSLKKHYISLAQSNYKKYIEKSKEANLKKYVYVLRAIGCLNFLEKNESLPPLNYKKLLDYFPDFVAIFMNDVVKRKKESEGMNGKINIKVNEYIEQQLIKKIEAKKEKPFDREEINRLVIKIINRNGKL